MEPEERAEKARREAVEAQAKTDRERELAIRKARVEAAESQPSLVVHGPAQK